ncbi:MAG: HAD-IA family hydrolase [Pseudomonadota bacterium]
MNPDLVIFDCDGVLIDSETIACAVEAEELNRIGFTTTKEEIARRFCGVPAPDMYAVIEAELGRALPEGFTNHVEDRIVARFRSDLCAIPGVARTIEALPWRFCVASSSAPVKLCLGLIESGLFDHFYPHVYSAVLVDRGKPAPDLFLHAAESMQAGTCVVVEDSLAGVRAARAADMPVLGFFGGSHCAADHAAMLEEAGAHAVFDRFEDLPEIVRGL